MTKYILLYIGGDSPASKEEGEMVMKNWMAWFDKYKDWVLDGGFPIKEGSQVIDKNGNVSNNDLTKVTGYSIFQVTSYEEVLKAAQGCPHLKAGGSVEIKEEMPLM